MVAIFFTSLIPPACATSGCIISIHPFSKYGLTSCLVNKRSPRAIGIPVIPYNALISSTWPGKSGSSMNRGRWDSSAFASCFAKGRWTRPWKSSPTSRPVDLTSFMRSIVASRTCGESSHPTYVNRTISSVTGDKRKRRTDSTAFIFTAVNPCSFLAFACSSTSEGRSPPIQPYTWHRSRLLATFISL